MGDWSGVQLPVPETYLDIYAGQLSLAIPLWVGAISIAAKGR